MRAHPRVGDLRRWESAAHLASLNRLESKLQWSGIDVYAVITKPAAFLPFRHRSATNGIPQLRLFLP